MSAFSFKILPEHNIFLEPGHASTEGGGTAATKHLLKAGGWEQEQPGWHGVTSSTRMATGHVPPWPQLPAVHRQPRAQTSKADGKKSTGGLGTTTAPAVLQGRGCPGLPQELLETLWGKYLFWAWVPHHPPCWDEQTPGLQLQFCCCKQFPRAEIPVHCPG